MGKQKRNFKITCLMVLGWTALGLFILLLIAFFFADSLFELGVWQEFWEMVGGD